MLKQSYKHVNSKASLHEQLHPLCVCLSELCSGLFAGVQINAYKTVYDTDLQKVIHVNQLTLHVQSIFTDPHLDCLVFTGRLYSFPE